MILSALAVRRPITTVMFFVAIMLLGVVAYQRLPVQLFPDMTFPMAGISVRSPKSAEENLRTITKPVEGFISELKGVKSISTRTSNNRVSAWITFEPDTDLQYTLVELEEKVLSFQTDLDDREAQFNVFAASTADFQRTYMYLSVKGDGDTETLFNLTADKVEAQLSAIDGVASVDMRGLRSKSAQVEFNTDLLASYGLELGQVINRVQSAAASDRFLGELKVPGETHYVRLNDKIETIDELAETFVDTRGVVRLKDVSEISLGESVREWISRRDGKNSIRVSIDREAGRNLIDLARATRVRVEEINETLPPGVSLVIDEDLAQYVEDAINDVKKLAGMGALLALFVPMVFFRSIRVAMIIFLSVPISLISVFNLFHAADMSINVLSIIGLALGVGMLVDNSIVVVENSFRLYGLGKSPEDAAAEGGVEVGRGLFAATLTTVIVFLPLVFQNSEMKEIFREPTLALVFPLLVSLLVALTIVPVFTALVLRTYKTRKNSWGGKGRIFLDLYRWILKLSIRHRSGLITVIIIAVMFTFLEGFSQLNSTTTSREPERDSLSFQWRPSVPGNALSDTNQLAQQLEARLAQHPDLKSFWVGFSAESGNFWGELKPQKERKEERSYTKIRQAFMDELGEIAGLDMSWDGFDVPASQGASLSFGTRDLIELKGLDTATLYPFADRLMEALRLHPLISETKLNDEPGQPIYQAKIDREKSRLFNITASQLGRYAASTQSGGTISSLVLEKDEEQTNVSFLIEDADSATLDSVKELTVYTAAGGQVPFGELVNFQTSAEEGFIRRLDRQDSIEMFYYFEPDADRSAVKDAVKEIASVIPNPGGVIVQLAGDAKKLDQRESDFIFLLLIGLLFVYIVMAAVFESFWVPLTIIATNPLMIIGIVWGLNLAGLPLDDLAFFGILLLVGLAVNNGIVMMDRALELQRRGYNRLRAVFEASITRLRPVVMTWATTVLGLLPMAMVGSEADQWRSLAVVIIGGLTSATVLTLVVLPCFYLIGDDFVAFAKPPLARFFLLLLEVVEGTLAILLHPLKVIRGEIPFLPGIRRLSSGILQISWQLLSLPVTMLIGLPGDSAKAFKVLVLGRSKPTDRAIAIAVSNDATHEPGKMGRLYSFFKAILFWPFGKLLLLWRWVVKDAPEKSERTWWVFLYRHIGLAPKRLSYKILASIVRTALDTTPPLVLVSGELPAPSATISINNLRKIYTTNVRDRTISFIPSHLRPGWLRFGGLAALDGVSLEMNHSIYGILGPNGAGKTTLLRAIAGLQEPSRGGVRLFGLSMKEHRAELAPLIGYLPQNHGVFDDMTLYEFLDYFALMLARTMTRARATGAMNPSLQEQLDRLRLLPDPVQRHLAIVDAAAAVNLSEHLDRKLGAFSGGMRQRAGIARILLADPPILIIDEPTAGLDPIERVRIRVLLSKLATRRLILLSTHLVDDLERGCDQLCVIDKGQVLYDGKPEALLAQWEGKLWQAPITETALSEMKATLVRDGANVLYRTMDDGQPTLRFLADRVLCSDARQVAPNLEDAFVALTSEAKGPIE